MGFSGTMRGVLGACLLSVAALGRTPGDEVLRAESNRRHAALVEAGYNLTCGFRLSGAQGANPTRLEFLVPESETEHRFSLWVEFESGEGTARLRDGAGKEMLDWQGRRLDLTFSRSLPSGKYVLELGASKAQGGCAEFGIKGPLMQSCPTDPVRCLEVPASEGFHWPYLLYVPRQVRHAVLLVAPNNTGFATEEIDLLRASARCEVQRQRALAERLGCPLLVPMFPRPRVSGEAENLYLHALSRAGLLVDAKLLKRVDLQLLAMIRHARVQPALRALEVGPKVLLTGFSASGSFVNRFAILHPEAVSAVACGSPGGWPMVPEAEFEGERLDYPVGVADLEGLSGMPLDEAVLKRVRWFFFLGGADTNDAVPFRDSFSKADEMLVMRRFGRSLSARWEVARSLFARKGLAAQFEIYPGVGHQVTPEIEEDIARFFEGQLKDSPGR